jgi:hypothetical protein
MTAASQDERIACTQWFPAVARARCLITFGYPRHAKKPVQGVYRGLLVVDGAPRRHLVDTVDGVTRFVETHHFHMADDTIERRAAA